MKTKRQLPGWAQAIIVLFVLLIVLAFTGSLFRKVPLAFFFLWFLCPFLAWGLRSPALDASLTSTGYSSARGLLLGISFAIAFLCFAHYDFMRDSLGEKYLNGYSVYYYEDIDEFGRSCTEADASASGFSGKAILYLFQWVMIALCIGIPFLTWRISGLSISVAERRKRESNNGIESDGE